VCPGGEDRGPEKTAGKTLCANRQGIPERSDRYRQVGMTTGMSRPANNGRLPSQWAFVATGWHSFRHGLATMLRQKGVDIKNAQELLRHANSRRTLDIYQQALSDEKRVAADLAFQGLTEANPSQHPSALSTLQHPRRQHERRGYYFKSFFLSDLW